MRSRSILAALAPWGLLIVTGCQTARLDRAVAPEQAERIPPAGPDVLQYDTRITVEVGARSITGATTILFAFADARPREIRFPLNGLAVDSVRYGDEDAPFRLDAAEDSLVIWPPGKRSSSPVRERVTVAYHVTPERGLVFGDRFVYTDFFTCHWMVCGEEPGDKAAFNLEVVVPASYVVVASGRPVGQLVDASGRVHSRWTEERPYSPYLYGFAAGELIETEIREGNDALRFLGVRGLESEASLRGKFQDTPRALRFLAARAGVPLPGGLYTQVLVPGREAQEKSSFSIIGADYLDPILEDPTEDWVIVHELAHQWWGNLVTCSDWSHFWLNEGLATFMVAAYKEDRWGRAAYDRELKLWRERWAAAEDAGFDVPLAYARSYPSLRVRRAIQYSKGAVFLHVLRERMGDASFWAGIRDFTRRHAGGTVTSADFERAMQEATRIDLTPLFRDWVGA